MQHVNPIKFSLLKAITRWCCLLALFIVGATNAGAQCTGTSQYFWLSGPDFVGESSNAGCIYAGMYNRMTSMVAGARYRFTSSVTTDYITIRSGTFNGPVVAFTSLPYDFVPTTTGEYYVHVNTDASCGTQSACRNLACTLISGSPESYCVPVNGGGNSYYFIGSVQLGTINKTSGINPATPNGYYSYATNNPLTGVFTYLTQGSAQTLTVSGGNVKAWIDFNADNDFDDAGEELSGGPTFYFTVPANATVAYTRLRVRETGGYYGSVGPCSVLNGAYGEIEDYLLYIQQAPTCTDMPWLGSAVTSNAGPLCVNSSFNLSVTSAPPQETLGLTYQWEVSTADQSGPFTAIAGLTNKTATIAVTAQTQSAWYRLAATCANSGQTGYSDPVNVTRESNINNCYCIPSTGELEVYINAVQLGTINNTSGANAPAPNYYVSYASAPTATQTTDLAQGIPQTLTVNVHATEWYDDGHNSVAAWVDYNADGDFDDAGELLNRAVSQQNGNVALTFMVPLTSVTGYTRLRVRANYDNQNMGPCDALAYYAGESEDYRVNIVALPSCTGAPAVGNVTSNTGAVCPSATFNLSLAAPLQITGITYQWQVSTAGASGPFTDIAGQTNIATTVTGQTQSSWYRLAAFCTNSNETGYSAALNVAQQAALYCTCAAPVETYLAGIHINSVQLGTINNAGANTTSYVSYATAPAPNQTTDLALGMPYTINVDVANLVGYEKYTIVAAWIDFNGNGNYTDVGELLGAADTVYAGNVALTFTVPAAALPGTKSLRIRQIVDLAAAVSPCDSFDTGEAEDYLVTLVAATPCDGTPVLTGVFSSNIGPLCSGTSFNLSVNAYPVAATGISYQWEASTVGATGPFTALVGQTNAAATVTGQLQTSWYRLVATCTNSGLSSTSAAVNVTQQSNIDACYCTPDFYIDDYALIGSVQLGTINNVTAPYGAIYTSYMTAPTATQTTNLARGSQQTITITLAVVDANLPQYLSAWIDFNRDGDFNDDSEQLGTSSHTTDSVASYSFTVPLSSLTGLTRLRVFQSVALPVQSACGLYAYGSAQDYPVTITPGCTGTPTLGNAATTNAGPICPGVSFNLSVNPAPVNPGGIVYQWEVSTVSASGPFIAIVGQTNTTTTVAGITQTSWYRLAATCNNFGLSSTSGVINVLAQPNSNACMTYCIPGYDDNYYSYVNAVQLGTINNTTGSNATVYTSYVNAPAANQTTNLARSSAQSITVNVAGNSGYNAAGAWIDFNGDGDFSDIGEQIINAGLLPDGNTSVSFTVPTTATVGYTRLRVRSRSNPFMPGMDPCETYLFDSGETEDYPVLIILPPCNGTPTLGDAVVYTSIPTCSGDWVTLGVNPAPSSNIGGITYQWQVSTAGTSGPFVAIDAVGQTTTVVGQTTLQANIAGQTLNSWYRLAATCANSGLTGYSGVVNVTVKSFGSCYCVPSFTNGNTDDYINSVLLGTINNVTGQNASAYTSYASAPTATQTTNLAQGSQQTIAVNFGTTYGGGNVNIGVWIDYDGNGDFNGANEEVGVAQFQQDGTVSLTFTVPATAVLGPTVLRVFELQLSNDPDSYPCGYFYGGEVEDYKVTITPACSTPTVSITPNGSTTLCQGASVTLTASGASTYAWSNGSTGSSIVVANAGSYAVTGTSVGGCTGASASTNVTVNPLPVVSIAANGPTSFCQGNSVTLTASGATSYLWNNGATTVSIVVTQAGSYSVIGTNVNNCTATSTATSVSVNPLPTVAIIPSGPLTVCVGGSVTLNASGASTYLWSNNATTTSINVTSAGSYSVVGTNANGCSGTSSPIAFATNPLPTITTSGITSICSGSNTTLTASGASTYVWQPGNLTTTSVMVSPTSTTTYTVTGTNANGCSNTATAVVAVTASNVIPAMATAINGPAGACKGQTGVVFSVPALANATSYMWTLPAGATGSSSTNTITVNFTNAFAGGNVCVKGVNVCNTGANFCRSITLYNVIPASTGNIVGSATVCKGSTQTYTVGSVPNATSYDWTVPANATIVSGQGTTNLTVSFSANFGSGVIDVKATNCMGSSNKKLLTVTGVGIPAQPSVIGGLAVVCKNKKNVTYSVTNVVGVTYNWTSPATSTIVAGQGTSSVKVNYGTQSGLVTVTASNQCGVAPIRTLNVTVANNACRDDESESSTNISSNGSLNLYPNPSNGATTLRFSASLETDYTVQLVDITGKVLTQIKGTAAIGENTIDIDVTEFANGMYFVNLVDGESIKTQKLIKQ